MGAVTPVLLFFVETLAIRLSNMLYFRKRKQLQMEKIMKKTIYTEIAYLIGIVLLALGTALMERADYGMSMVVAPAYILYLKISQTWSFFTFGMAEYVIQALLLVLLCIVVRKAKFSYLFSFVTTVFYGIMLDGFMLIMPEVGMSQTVIRVVFFLAGFLVCAMGVSLLFHTYIAPEAYELFVKEVSDRYNLNINKVKTVYDCTSCLVGILASFIVFGFGHFEGVKAGTFLCAIANGFTIGCFTRFFEKHWSFKNKFLREK